MKSWPTILIRAREIMLSYDTPVTLRQLFYRLVSEQLIPNDKSSYKTLSSRTARAREKGIFPHFIDQNRQIDAPVTFDGPADAVNKLARFYYRRDRTEGQQVGLYLGVEKRGIVEQLRSWFGHLGIPIVALSGYGSVTLLHDLEIATQRQNRPCVLVYAGDWDASGEGIQTDFERRPKGRIELLQIALTEEQVATYNLPINQGNPKDPRAARFLKKYGRLVQVELDSLPPEVLRQLFAKAIARVWDDTVYANALSKENEEREQLSQVSTAMSEA